MEMWSWRKDWLLKKNSKEVVEALDPEEGLVLEEKKKQYSKTLGDRSIDILQYNHIGCAVSEESFDCHGSRFSASREEAVNGPANNDHTYW